MYEWLLLKVTRPKISFTQNLDICIKTLMKLPIWVSLEAIVFALILDTQDLFSLELSAGQMEIETCGGSGIYTRLVWLRALVLSTTALCLFPQSRHFTEYRVNEVTDLGKRPNSPWYILEITEYLSYCWFSVLHTVPGTPKYSISICSINKYTLKCCWCSYLF